MANTFFVGLGGSGGKIIKALHDSLEAHGELHRFDDVVCIAIDTDQDELDKLTSIGAKTICISDRNSVGQVISELREADEDISDWCPTGDNEGVFKASSLHTGASQCRLKSRLALAKHLKNDNNSLKRAIEGSLSQGTTASAPPRVLVASSIAGGTGSGIFIQIALYIRKIFKEKNINNVKIDGLFACPSLYLERLTENEKRAVQANAYAVVRELNAFSMIGGDNDTGISEGIDIEISTKSEGSLFTKNQRGRYGEKPYDMMYFVDKVNTMSKVLGGLEKYYEIMGDMAYTMLYAATFGKLETLESNIENNKKAAPMAIYGSSGVANLEYPYEDVVKYVAKRYVLDFLERTWLTIDEKWESYLAQKRDIERARSGRSYTPKENEKAEYYVSCFDELTESGLDRNDFTAMADQAKRDEENAADVYVEAIKNRAKLLLIGDPVINSEKKERNFDDIDSLAEDVKAEIEGSTRSNNDNVFDGINEIEESFEEYCVKCIARAVDIAIEFSNVIIPESVGMLEENGREELGIVKNLLKDQSGNWVHPVVARYLLYSFIIKVQEVLKEKGKGIDTPASDDIDFLNHLFRKVEAHRLEALGIDDQTGDIVGILNDILDSKLFPKLRAKKNTAVYFDNLKAFIKDLDKSLENAVLFFTYTKVKERVDKLISQYEIFFATLDTFKENAESKISSLEKSHEKARGTTIYVCADAETKKSLYETVIEQANTNDGSVGGKIAQSLFYMLRKNAFGKKRGSDAATSKSVISVASFYDEITEDVFEFFLANADVAAVLNMDLFSAIKKEQELKAAVDENQVKPLKKFVEEKFQRLLEHASPFLLYNLRDTYDSVVDEHRVEDKSVPHIIISHGDVVMRSLLTYSQNDISTAGEAEMAAFYAELVSSMPANLVDANNPAVFVRDNMINQYRICCCTMVQCLQACQIQLFDEAAGGECYKEYSERLELMERTKLYSQTPHLDIRWHVSGCLPYISPKLDEEKKYILAKALLYALVTKKIGYEHKGSQAEIFYTYYEAKDKEPSLVRYKNRKVHYAEYDKLVHWLASREFLCADYASKFDTLVKNELGKAIAYREDISKYESVLTRNSVLSTLRKNVISSVEASLSLTGKKAKTAKKELSPINILTLAKKIRDVENNDVDKNYAELIILVLCDTVDKYAAAPFGKTAYGEGGANESYQHVVKHILDKFMESFNGTSSDIKWVLDNINKRFPEYVYFADDAK